MCIQFHELSIFDVRLLVSNSSSRLVLEIDIGERVAVGVADDEAGVAAFTAPGETKAPTRACRGQCQTQALAPVDRIKNDGVTTVTAIYSGKVHEERGGLDGDYSHATQPRRGP